MGHGGWCERIFVLPAMHYFVGVEFRSFEGSGYICGNKELQELVITQKDTKGVLE